MHITAIRNGNRPASGTHCVPASRIDRPVIDLARRC
ncbi:MAG: hypothetical protein AVDCRST_MAG88-4317, partial [uncultured Thermomicrobiales bacterium]